MPVKYFGEDEGISIVVDRRFDGDLREMASSRPVWIVDSEHNQPKTDAVWALHTDRTLFEVRRFPRVPDDCGDQGLFFDILDGVELHCEGFAVAEQWASGFTFPGWRHRSEV